MRILVTGYSGFIGTEFIKQAEHAGHEVVGLSREEWTNYEAMLGFPWSHVDALVHLAAAGVKRDSHRNWYECMEVNFHALRRLLRAIKATPTIFLARSIRESDMDGDHLLWDDPYYASKKLGGLFASTWAESYAGKVIMPQMSSCYNQGRVQVLASLILRDIAK